MKTHIIIHLLPFEIDRFEYQILELKKCSLLLDVDDKVVIDATLNLNDLLIDWKNSSIPKEFFIDRFLHLKNLCDWTHENFFEIDTEEKCLGINAKRRNSIRQHANSCDTFLYLDCDMIFPVHTLKYMIDAVKHMTLPYYIISPQSTQLWDGSWCNLVNESYAHIPHDKITEINPFEVCSKQYGDVEIVPVNDFKFGGGWFNLFSSKLLSYTDIPDELGGYGLDDLYVMQSCQVMKNLTFPIQQYVLKNLVVTQNYRYGYHMQDVYKKFIPFINKKEMFITNAKQNYGLIMNRFLEKCKHDIIHSTNS